MGLIKGKYLKNHGTAKKGDEREFHKSTYEQLVKAGVLESQKAPKKEKDNPKEKGK